MYVAMKGSNDDLGSLANDPEQAKEHAFLARISPGSAAPAGAQDLRSARDRSAQSQCRCRCCGCELPTFVGQRLGVLVRLGKTRLAKERKVSACMQSLLHSRWGPQGRSPAWLAGCVHLARALRP